MTADDLEKRFEDLIARIERATGEVDSGSLADFDALNQEIMDVCSATQAAGPETAKALQKQMGKIILKLDELAVSITKYKDNLEGKGK